MKFKYIIVDEDGWVTGSNSEYDFRNALTERGYDSVIDVETGTLYAQGDDGTVYARSVKQFKLR